MRDVSTPAFLVDREIVDRNCVAMRRKALDSAVLFRPHVKTHKTLEVARMQHGGSLGPITVSTLAEAEFFAAGGFRNITYGFPIAPEKIGRAAALAAEIDQLNLLVDSEVALRALESAGGVYDVWLKVDCGYHRAGVDPSDPDSVRLVKELASSPHVRFHGLLTHAGHSYNVRNMDEVRVLAADETGVLTRFRERLAEEGVGGILRSIGSTPTCSSVERFTDTDEVRPGNYVFFDAFQAALGSCTLNDCAVSVMTTVVGSYPGRGQAVIDAGALALSKDRGAEQITPAGGYGLVCDLQLQPLPMRLTALSQEHGLMSAETPPPVGTKLRVIPNHSCLTAAMFDRYHVVSDGEVVDEWRPARGW